VRLLPVGAGAAVALALAVGGCSTADDDPTTGAPSPAKATATASATVAAAATASASASATILEAIDFVYTKGPEDADLTETGAAMPKSPSDRDSYPYADIAECFGQTADKPTSSASGPELTGPEGVFLINSYAHIVTPAQLNRHAALLREGDLPGCIMSILSDGNVEAMSTWTTRNTPLPPGARARISLVVPTQQAGGPVTLYSEIIFFGAGRVEAELLVASTGKPADDVVEHAAARYVERLHQQ